MVQQQAVVLGVGRIHAGQVGGIGFQDVSLGCHGLIRQAVEQGLDLGILALRQGWRRVTGRLQYLVESVFIHVQSIR